MTERHSSGGREGLSEDALWQLSCGTERIIPVREALPGGAGSGGGGAERGALWRESWEGETGSGQAVSPLHSLGLVVTR